MTNCPSLPGLETEVSKGRGPLTLQSRKSQTKRDVLVGQCRPESRPAFVSGALCEACMPSALPLLVWEPGVTATGPGGTRTCGLDLSFPSPALWPVHPRSQVCPPTRPPRGAVTTACQPVARPAKGPSISRESKFPALLPRLQSQGKRRQTRHSASSGAGIFCTPWRPCHTSRDGRKH